MRCAYHGSVTSQPPRLTPRTMFALAPAAAPANKVKADARMMYYYREKCKQKRVCRSAMLM